MEPTDNNPNTNTPNPANTVSYSVKLESWHPTTPGLSYWFEPTNTAKRSEVRKAQFKNLNIPVLQFIYQGSETATMTCSITKTPAWTQWPNLVTGAPKQRFDIDFNHVRQRARPAKQGGDSVDKSKYDPSAVFRGIDLAGNIPALMEFMTCMPVSRAYHRYITQDSAMGNITLRNYDKDSWTWSLRSESNYNQVREKYNLPVTYQWLVDHLSNIDYPSIRERLGNKDY